MKNEGRIEEGISYYKRALHHNSKYPSSWYNLGVAYAEKGRPDDAKVCVAEGTLVALANGTSVPIERMRVGAEVLSYYAALAPGETEGLTVRRVSAVLDQGYRTCVELLFSDKRTLVCTPDHRIRAADGRWVEAGELVVGVDEVAVDEDPDVYRSVEKVTSVHRDAKVRPLFRVRLVGRREVGVQHVYDLSVPSTQGEDTCSFTANGLVVHNCYEMATLFDSKCAEAFNNLGVIYKDRGNLDQAIHYYHEALTANPAFSQTLNNLSVIYTMLGKLDEAYEYC